MSAENFGWFIAGLLIGSIGLAPLIYIALTHENKALKLLLGTAERDREFFKQKFGEAESALLAAARGRGTLLDDDTWEDGSYAMDNDNDLKAMGRRNREAVAGEIKPEEII